MKPRENLLSWQVFLTTAVTKNISKTSIELDMDLKTVSRIVKELESDLGFILFDRSCRPFKLTEGAEKILPLAKELLRTKNKIEYKVQDFLLKPTEIRLSLPVNMTRDDLFELMDKYASAHPNLKIRLLNDCDHKHLLDNETDVAMLPYLPQNDEDEMVLFDAGFSYNMLLASPEYIRRNGAPQSLDELKAHPLILSESRIYPITKTLEHGDERINLDPEFKLRYLGDAFSCKTAALMGKGIAVDLSLAYCKEEIEESRLVPLLPGWHRPKWTMIVAIRKEDAKDKAVCEFAQWFADRQKEAYPSRWKPLFNKLPSDSLTLPQRRPSAHQFKDRVFLILVFRLLRSFIDPAIVLVFSQEQGLEALGLHRRREIESRLDQSFKFRIADGFQNRPLYRLI